MQWSQLKKRIENTFAPAVHGRVEVWATRYRGSHDEEGEAWITFDKQKIANMATYTHFAQAWQIKQQLWRDNGFCNKTDYYWEVESRVRKQGFFPLWDLYRALFEYLNLSIDAILESKNPIIRAFGVLDKRFGKRRLLSFDASQEHVLVKKFYTYRCIAENIKTAPTRA